ncbi:hypothetical protein B7759_04372 [Burkholderia glumae]|nr:DDE domain protein [Burkholderia glumae LMG 2196 = ATCC 33617]QKM57121.1 hypothetical protein CG017_05189 [Burkholderia glumae]QTP35738.1 hypothetical protein B7759_04372 [Burkholderia glumae]
MEVVIRRVKHSLWRAVNQHGAVIDVLVQRQRNAAAARRLMRRLLKRHGRPRVKVTDKLRSYAAANIASHLRVKHRHHDRSTCSRGVFRNVMFRQGVK